MPSPQGGDWSAKITRMAYRQPLASSQTQKNNSVICATLVFYRIPEMIASEIFNISLITLPKHPGALSAAFQSEKFCNRNGCKRNF
jgi:hypothetical protein